MVAISLLILNRIGECLLWLCNKESVTKEKLRELSLFWENEVLTTVIKTQSIIVDA